jgi:hypothetical protein
MTPGKAMAKIRGVVLQMARPYIFVEYKVIS